MAGKDNATGTTLNIVNWVFTGLSIAIVGARMYARVFKVQRIGIDDFLMLCAMLCAILMSCFISVSIHYGLGGTVATVASAKFSFLAGIPVLLCQMFGRVSWAFTLLVLMGTTPTRRSLLYFLAAFQIIWNIVALALSYGMCRPVEVFWDPNISNSTKCLDLYHTVVVGRWQYFQTAWDTVTDLALALFPALVLKSLQIDLSMRIGLSCLMGLGVFTAAITIVKAVEYGILFANPTTSSYSQVDIYIWTVLQADIVIIAASIPSCLPLFRGSRSAGQYEGGIYKSGSFASRGIGLHRRKHKSYKQSYGSKDSRGSTNYTNKRANMNSTTNNGTQIFRTESHPSAATRSTSQDSILPHQQQSNIV